MRGLSCCAAATAFALIVGGLGGCKGASEDTAAPAADGPRVLVFGIDGGTWDVARELFDAGELPTLRALYDGGVHGVLESRPPAISPVVWSTIFTGRPHSEHGVESWKTSHSTHRKVKAVWDITSAAGLMTHVFNVPSTWPPTEVSGVMVSGFPLSGSTVGGNTGQVVSRERIDAKRLPGCYAEASESLSAAASRLEAGAWSDYLDVPLRGRPSWKASVRIKNLGGGNYYLTPCYRTDEAMVITYPPGLAAEIQEDLGEPYVAEGPGWSKHAEPETPGYLSQHLVQVSRNQTRVVRDFMGGPWQLAIYVDTLVDRVSHPYWAYMEPQNYNGLDPNKAEKYKDEVRDAYRETDLQLAALLDAIDGEVYVVLASDHGFHSSRNRDLFIGTHDFDGIFLVNGPGLTGTSADRAFIEDIGPTVLYLLGLPVAGDMKGKVIPAVAAQLARPINTIPSYETSEPGGEVEPVDAKTWRQLQEMGYVDPDEPAPRAQQRKESAESVGK